MKKNSDKFNSTNTSNNDVSRNNYTAKDKDLGSKTSKSKRKTNGSKTRNQSSGTNSSNSIVSSTLNAILTDTAAINFPNRTGNEYKIGEWLMATKPSAGTVDQRLRYIEPGIMKIDYIPTYGVVKDAHSGINAIATKIYTTMRTYQTGSTNYDAADLIGYICGWDQCNAVVAFIKRILRIANTWIMNNTYTPQALIESQGIKFEDTVTNLTEYRVRLNRLIFQLNTFYVPNVLPIIERHQQLCENFYMDRLDSTKAQFLYFYPRAFFKLVMNSSVPTALVMADTPRSTLSLGAPTTTVGKLLDFLQSLIAELVNNSVVDTMSGDLQRSFGADKQRLCYILESDSYGIPLYDEELLDAVHNLKTVRSSIFEPNTIQYTVTAETNMFTFGPTLKTEHAYDFPTEKTLYVVDFPTDTPSAVDIINTARFITAYDDTNKLLIGSEWFVAVDVITKKLLKDRTGDNLYKVHPIVDTETGWYNATAMRDPETDKFIGYFTPFYIMPFRKAPIVPYLVLDSMGEVEHFFFIGETNNVGTMEIANLIAIEDTVMYVLFGLQ